MEACNISFDGLCYTLLEWDQAPSIVVRIVRDAAGAVVDLVIEEFNWEDRSPRFAQIRMNFL